VKRCQFTLAGVLRLRVQQTEAAEVQLSLMHQELQQIQERQQALLNDLRRDQADLFRPDRPLSGEDLVQMDEYRRWVTLERRRQDQEAAECIARIQEQNRKVLEAKRNQQLLEKLRDRGRQRWEVESAREEQALAEEAFMSQWGKQQESE
jgi:flagellar export protein FliJ